MRSLLLHAKWKTKPRALSTPPGRTRLFLRLAWNKKLWRGFEVVMIFFLFSPLDSRFDIDHVAVLCNVFSLISGSALRRAAVEQRGCSRLVLVSQSYALLPDLSVNLLLRCCKRDGSLWERQTGWPPPLMRLLFQITAKESSGNGCYTINKRVCQLQLSTEANVASRAFLFSWDVFYMLGQWTNPSE